MVLMKVFGIDGGSIYMLHEKLFALDLMMFNM